MYEELHKLCCNFLQKNLRFLLWTLRIPVPGIKNKHEVMRDSATALILRVFLFRIPNFALG